MIWLFVLLAVAVLLAVWIAYDLIQSEHAVVRNFPIIGHFRYWLEAVGPELRQYIVTDNDEERPFSRDQRRWVYASAKRENNHFGFGTDNEMELTSNYLVLQPSAFPLSTLHLGEDGYRPDHPLPVAKTLGAHRGRAKAFRPRSVVNISGMSFGALSGRAVEAMNRGAELAGCLHNTGEGGVSEHHLHGGELIFQIGTGYFGCCDEQGRFDIERLVALTEEHPIRAIEIKLSQGAKAGLGGLLPGEKVSREISRVRGVPEGVDCISPASHALFSDVDGMLDVVESVADRTGLPVGIKSAVGGDEFWVELAHLMATTGRGVDFVTVDGGEGGTGAAPRAFADHVALPFKLAMSRVYRAFAREQVHQQVVFIGSGKLGFPEQGALAMALGCDMLNVGREAMLAVGCIQAQRCHTGHCPTGVATQNRRLIRGLDVRSKSVRVAAYIEVLRSELVALSHACGVSHPSQLTADQFEILDGRFGATSARELFGYEPGWGVPHADDIASVEALMTG